jgi:polysaccharide export outer membrane protein
MKALHPDKSKPTAAKRRRVGWLWTLAFCTAQLAGCQTETIRARKLPSEWRAKAATGNRAIDYSRVAATGVSDSLIGGSDLLEITVTNGREEELNNLFLVRVSDEGVADVPVIGPVRVAGLEEFEAGRQISQQAIQRGIYLHPTITVEIKKKAMNRITVIGAVSEPGIIELPRNNSDILSAVAAAKGVTEEAGTEVEVIRQPSVGYAQNAAGQIVPGRLDSPVQLASHQGTAGQDGAMAPQSVRIDLASKEGPASGFQLQDRDVVRILPRKVDRLFVTGLVQQPGQFILPLEQDVHLLDAISMAGGTSSLVADKVYVIRRVADREEPLVIRASLSEAKRNGLENLRLAAGDTVSVEQTPATALVDTFEKFFRFSYGVATSSFF